MSLLNIAICQFDIKWEDKVTNRSFIEQQVEQLADGTDLFVLPEMFTTGFTMKSDAFAETMDDDTVKWLKELSKKSSVAIMGSIVARNGDNRVNRMLFVKPDGTVDYYDKKHLFRMGEENENYTAGTERKVFEYKGMRICPQICYDLRFPVWSRNRNDYDVLVYVANWPKSRRELWKALLMARALENQCYVVAVNRVGTDGMQLDYSGDSMIIDYKGSIIARAVPDKEDTVQGEINSEELEDFREKFPAWKDADDFILQ